MTNDKTRKSSVVMMSLFGVIFLLVFILIVVGRLSVSRMASSDNEENWRRVDFSDTQTTDFDVKDFRSVTFIGSWKVDMVQGDEWKVELTYPKVMESSLEVEIRGDELTLNPGRHNRYKWSWGWWGNNHDDRRLSARITMPELTALNIAGASDLDFEGFSGENLIITISGAGDIDGDDGQYNSLNLTMSGAGDVNLRKMKFVDANVILSGAGNVELGMDGGVLAGTLSGFGNIEYSGNVKDERVNVSGFGKVGRRD